MFWQFVKESLLIQGILALLFSGVVAYLYITGQPVPGELLGLVTLILGFYFGQKTAISAEVQARNVSRHCAEIVAAAWRKQSS